MHKVTLSFVDPNIPRIHREVQTKEQIELAGRELLGQYAGVKVLTVAWESGEKSVYSAKGEHLFTVPVWVAA